MSRRPYITRARVAEITERLRPLHWALLTDVARLNVVSGRQLRQLHYPDTASGQRAARRDLAQLVQWRVLARLDRRIGGVRSGSDGFVYRLDVVGQRLLEPERQRYRTPWTPSATHLAHALAVSDLYVQLHRESAHWKMLAFDTEPRCWRSFSGPGGAPVVLKPDAFVVGAAGDFEDSWFIEVDRATESLPRITDKAKRYISYWQTGREQRERGVFPKVLWVVPDEHRAVQVVDVLGRFDPEHWQLFGVATAVEAAARLRGHGQPAPGESS